MLAPTQLPEEFQRFNRHWGVPNGRAFTRVLPRRFLHRWWAMPLVGPFALEKNNSTRAFEYPWAFSALQPAPGVRVLEIGGGLSGFQFVLDRSGCQVVNVDPGETQFDRVLGLSDETFTLLNRRLGTSVVLKRCLLEEADFPDECFDRIVSISVLEHVPDEFLWPLLHEARRVLRPGGIFVMTIDLFLDVVPFTNASMNIYGRNANVKDLIAESGLQLVHGRPAELYGFPEFDAARIKAEQAKYFVGEYPTMVQTVILKKPAM